MAETAINAFAMDVEDKRVAMVTAEGAYHDAVAALKAHPDYEEPKKAEDESEDSEAEESSEKDEEPTEDDEK